MKSLFRPRAEAEPTDFDPSPSVGKPSGWDGVGGTVKIALVAALAGGVAVAVFLPDFERRHSPSTAPTGNNHAAAPIVAIDGPPPATSIANRVTGEPAPDAPPPPHHRAVPTEMALYTAPSSRLGGGRGADGSGAEGAAGGESSGSSGSLGQGRLASEIGGATRLAKTYATLVRNPDFLIRPGAVIPCLPIDAQNSTRPGFTSCIVNDGYRSSNLRRQLLPPGTRIFGQIRSGLMNGEQRLGVLYTRIETPLFDVNFDAPGADEMGRAGLDGDIHNFFWEKAGAVALYSLMDVAIGAGQNLASSALSNAFNGSGGTTLNLGSQGQSLASQQFGATINRPSILTRDQALPMTVTVGQDIDFTEPCQKAMQVNPMACPLE